MAMLRSTGKPRSFERSTNPNSTFASSRRLLDHAAEIYATSGIFPDPQVMVTNDE
jgi:hypothetical protein